MAHPRLACANLDFIALAVDNTWMLDIAIYEYVLDEIRLAVNAAALRGAKVRIVYHAKPGTKEKTENEASLKHSPLPPGVTAIPRVPFAIMHDKFIVLSKLKAGARDPQAVLCGSTNFTENGVYRQANVVHVLDRPEIVQKYLAQFELLVTTASDAAQTRVKDTQDNPVTIAAPHFVGFSPRSGKTDLAGFIQIARRQTRHPFLHCVRHLSRPACLARRQTARLCPSNWRRE
jgi:phosphatidylserine/phosphatidylglycerophosphate/cardiolipin synthase-like enzyme